jgi:CMP-N,N'-diacetyllegionaminic acid synthase
MSLNKKILAVILARGGSKRLPRKNVIPLYKKPLISWSIEAALKSKYIDKIVISSDDDEILNISNHFKKATSIKRPSELATDQSTSFDALKHVLKIFKGYEYIILLQPTSPLRDENHINQAIELVIKKNAEAAVSVCQSRDKLIKSFTLDKSLLISNYQKIDDDLNKNSNIKNFYKLNGAIYICKVEQFLKEKSFLIKNKTFGYVMSEESSIDIDEKVDFELASLYMSKKLGIN